MGDVKGQKKRNLEESQEKQRDGGRVEQGAPLWELSQHRNCPRCEELRHCPWFESSGIFSGLRSSGTVPAFRSSSSPPWLLPGFGTSLFLPRVWLWGALLRLSINVFLLGGSHTVLVFADLWSYREWWLKVQRVTQQLPPSLGQKCSAASLVPQLLLCSQEGQECCSEFVPPQQLQQQIC